MAKFDPTSARPVEDPIAQQPGGFDPSTAKEEGKSGIARRVLGDGAISLLGKGVVGAGEALVGLADLAGAPVAAAMGQEGGALGRGLADTTGYDPKATKAFFDEYLSPEQKMANQRLDQAEGFVDTLGAAIDNPSTIAHTVAESVPSMLGGGAVGQAARAIPGIGSRIAPWAAGALGEGAIGAGSAHEQIRQESGGSVDPRGQLSALGSGIGTALFGALGGKVAQRMGITDIDTVLAGGGAAPGVRGALATPARMAGGAVTEGVLQEAPQSMQEQAWQNYALGRDLDEGLGEAAAMGVLAGGVMGAGAGAFSGRPQQQDATFDDVPDFAPAADPLALPAPSGPLSRAVQGLPAPVVPPMLPAPEQPIGITDQRPGAFAVDPQGNASPTRMSTENMVWNGQDYVPAVQADNLGGGAGMDRQAPTKAPAAPREPLALTDQREPGFAVDSQGNITPTKLPAVTKAERLPGGPGMDEAAPTRAQASADRVEKAVRRALDDGREVNPASIAMDVGATRGRVSSTLRAVQAERAALATDFKSSPGARKALNSMLRPDEFEVVKGAEPKTWRVQRKKVSEPVKQSATQDIAGEKIDGEWRSFKPESGTLSIPRAEMPQIKAEHRGAMVGFLKARGIQHQEQTVPATDLKPTQAEFSADKVAKARGFTGGDRAILVSKDGHVLDGHHQWMAKREAGENVRVIRLDAPIKKLLDEVRQFPSSTTDGGSRPVLQNRDRSTPASISQMRSIASAPDYGRLGFSRDFANGAPVVEPGASIPASRMGKKDYTVTGAGRRIPVQYAVVEASDVLASNNADGSVNVEYAAGTTGRSRAVAGNGRMAGLQRAYDDGTASGYMEAMRQDAALHGIPESAMQGMKRPVLVRVMPQDEVTPTIGDESNTTGTAALSGADQARNDARRIDLDGMQFSDDGRITDDTVRQFVRSMPQAEQSGLLDGGQPSRQAHDRLASAIFTSAYESEGLTRLQAQASDPEIRNIMSGLLQAAPKMARLKGAGDLDLRPLVAEAAEVALNARRADTPLGAFIEQMDMGRNPEIEPILRMMADNARSSKRIAEQLGNLADAAYNESNKPAADMFGAVEKRSRREILGAQNDTESAQAAGQPAGQGLDEAGNGRQAVDAGRSEAARPAQEQAQERESQLDAAPLDFERFDVRPGTTASQVAIGQDAYRSVLLPYEVAAGAKTLANGIAKDFREKGGASLIGQKIGNADDLAALAQVYRDPRFETFRVFFTKGGEVVGQTGITSRLPGVVSVFKVDGRGAGVDVELLKGQMSALDADGYWVTHNHPSGKSEPSTADMRLTEWIGDKMPGLQGHVIVNQNEFSQIDLVDGRARQSTTHRDFADAAGYSIGDPTVAHDMLGKNVGSPEIAAELAKSLQTRRGYVTIIGATPGMNVKTIFELPESLMNQGMKTVARLRRIGRETGTDNLFAVAHQPVDSYRNLVEQGLLVDVVNPSAAKTARSFIHPEMGTSTMGRKVPRTYVSEKAVTYQVDEVEEQAWLSGLSADQRKSPAITSMAAAMWKRMGTDSPFFKQWFGDSKVRSSSTGKPIAMYHGTDASFTQFEDRSGSATGFSASGLGIFLTPDRALAERYGQNVMPLYVKLQRPYMMTVDESASFETVDAARRFADSLKRKGYDGIYLKANKTAIVFDPSQVKSSTQNVGAFNEIDPDIRYSQVDGTPVGGSDINDVQALVDRLSASWKNAPTINVVKSVDDLPFKASGRAAGVFHDGQVYMVADNLASPRHAEFVLLHETMGHFGLAGTLGQRMAPVMRSIYRDNAQVRAAADAWMKANNSTDTALATEEALSDFQGDFTALTGWERLVAALRNALRAIGFNLEMSDLDVAKLLQNSRRWVESGNHTMTSDMADRLSQGHVEDMFLGHNLSVENLRHALDLGGLPAPSLAVARTTTGAYDGFGEITLLAPKELIGRSDSPLFNADVYSPRQPRAQYKVNRKAFAELDAKLRELPGSLRRVDEEEFSRHGIDELGRSEALKLQFLNEHGAGIKMPKQKLHAHNRQAVSFAQKKGYRQAWQLNEDDQFIALAKSIADKQLAELSEAEGGRVERYRSIWLNDDGTVASNFVRELAQKAISHIDNGGIDRLALSQAIGKKMRNKKTSEAFDAYTRELGKQLSDGQVLRVGNKVKPYTLENVTAEMIRELRGGERFNYGSGNIRAMYAAQIRSLSEARNRREEIVSGEEFAKHRKESNERLVETLEALKPYYRFDANGWGYTDDASAAIAEGEKGLREAFKLDAEGRKIVSDYISYVRNLPTEYFEMKVQRSMPISEFAGAVVPSDAPTEIFAALEQAGVQVQRYNSKTPGARAKAIARFKDLRFSQAWDGKGYPLAPPGTRYQEVNAEPTWMSPDDYLSRVKKLTLDDESRDSIDALKDHILSGRKLDPLHIYKNGEEDGRHRAHAAKELGIAQVPVIEHADDTLRYSQADSWMGKAAPFKIEKRSLARGFKGKLADMKPALLGAIPLNYLRDFAPKSMTTLDRYLDEKREMDAFRNEMHSQYDATAQKWLKLNWSNRKDADALSDLMHESTIAGTDPAEAFKESKTLDDAARKVAHARLKQRFDALSPEAQAMFREVRDQYRKQSKTLDSVIMENIRKAGDYMIARAGREYEKAVQDAKETLEGQEQRDAIEAATKLFDRRHQAAKDGHVAKVVLLRKAFESSKLAGPYFPLKRFGDYFVGVKDGDKLVSFSMFEKAADMEKAAEQLRRDNPGMKVTVGRQSIKQEIEGAVDAGFVAEVQELVSGLPNSSEIRRQIYQKYLESLPDFSMRKAFINRKNTPGFERDALRTFSSAMFHSAHQIARLKHSLEMNELVEQAEEQAKAGADPVDGMTIANELRKRHEWVMNPQGGKLAQHITSAAFVYQLGITPAAALVNTSQTFMMGVPIIGTRFGSEAKALAALGKASKDFVLGRGHIENKLQGDEAKAFAELSRMGVIEKTQAHDLAGVGETGVEYSAVRHKVMSVISWMFHNAERYNREVTAMAAYRMGRESGLSHEAAIKESADLTWTTHFDYSSGNRARYMQSDTAKVLLVFRQHNVNMISRLVIDGRNALKGESKEVRSAARRRLLGIVTMFSTMAGVMGVPGIYALLAVANMLDDDDDPWTAEDKFRKAIMETLGPDIGRVVLNGVPGTLSDVSLTERIGMGNFWFYSPQRDMEGQEAYQYWVQQVLGAAPAMVSNAFTGMRSIGEGNVYRGIETMMPKAIKDLMKGGRFAAEGVQTYSGDMLVDEVSNWNVISQAMGFTPAIIAERYEENNALKSAEQRILRERRHILNRYALSIRTGDTDLRNDMLAKARDFSTRYPTVAITGKSFSGSLKSRAQRDARTEGGLALDKRLGYLRDGIASTD